MWSIIHLHLKLHPVSGLKTWRVALNFLKRNLEGFPLLKTVMSQHSPPKCIFPQPCSINYKNEWAKSKNSATYFDCAPKNFLPKGSCHSSCSKHLCVVLLQAIWHCLTLNFAVLFSPSQTSMALGCGQHVTLAKTSNTMLCMDLKRLHQIQEHLPTAVSLSRLQFPTPANGMDFIKNTWLSLSQLNELVLFPCMLVSNRH